MSTPKKSSILATLLICVFAVAAFVLQFNFQRVCEWSGGKWASTERRCFTASCYDTHDCGSWACPVRECANIRVGDSERILHFRLGNPARTDGDLQFWEACKGGNDIVSATVQSHVVTELRCPKSPKS